MSKKTKNADEIITTAEEASANVYYPALEDAETEGVKICTPTMGNLRFALGRIAPTRLNIREKPSRAARIVCVEPKDALLRIDYDGSDDGWYKVTTEDGAGGYCMRAFVEILE